MKINYIFITILLLLLNGCGNSKYNLVSLEKACNNGYASKCTELGTEYSLALKVNGGSEFKAFEAYKKACAGNDMNGCDQLATYYAIGRGTRKNNEKAVEIYRKTCSMGSLKGCDNLGWAYVVGRGVHKNIYKGKELIGQTCDKGYSLGCRHYSILVNKGY